MIGYKQMAAVLAAKLTDEEFTQLLSLMDHDMNGNLFSEVTAVDYTRHVETYGPLCACRHPEGEHSAIEGDRFCYCKPCDCPQFAPRER